MKKECRMDEEKRDECKALPLADPELICYDISEELNHFFIESKRVLL